MILRYFLSVPFLVLFGCVLTVRHICYHWGIFKSHSFDFPVICVGNLAVGGTGKTPHTAMIAKVFRREGIKFAILSRGYKRKSRGFFYVENSHTAGWIGDEPLQTKLHFPEAIVAVCENRVGGIRKIKEEHPDIQVVILDDAFQHRKVTAGLSVLLTTHGKLITHDHLLPFGTLRDLAMRRHAADMVVITKCPATLRPIDFNILEKEIKLYPYQQLYFTHYRYLPLVNLMTKETVHLDKNSEVIALAGIAHPHSFFEYLEKTYTLEQRLTFSDHHHFGEKSVQKIRKTLQAHPENTLVTTEKDAMRLLCSSLDDNEKGRIVYQPIQVEFLNQGEEIFNQNLLRYVRENKRISLFC